MSSSSGIGYPNYSLRLPGLPSTTPFDYLSGRCRIVVNRLLLGFRHYFVCRLDSNQQLLLTRLLSPDGRLERYRSGLCKLSFENSLTAGLGVPSSRSLPVLLRLPLSASDSNGMMWLHPHCMPDLRPSILCCKE